MNQTQKSRAQHDVEATFRGKEEGRGRKKWKREFCRKNSLNKIIIASHSANNVGSETTTHLKLHGITESATCLRARTHKWVSFKNVSSSAKLFAQSRSRRRGRCRTETTTTKMMA